MDSIESPEISPMINWFFNFFIWLKDQDSTIGKEEFIQLYWGIGDPHAKWIWIPSSHCRQKLTKNGS